MRIAEADTLPTAAAPLVLDQCSTRRILCWCASGFVAPADGAGQAEGIVSFVYRFTERQAQSGDAIAGGGCLAAETQT